MASKVKEPVELPKKRIPYFDLNDRCDLCHAEALVRAFLPISAKLPKGGMLELCHHHGKSSLPGLAALGCEIEYKNSPLVWN